MNAGLKKSNTDVNNQYYSIAIRSIFKLFKYEVNFFR